jgi:hypothetical protein
MAKWLALSILLTVSIAWGQSIIVTGTVVSPSNQPYSGGSGVVQLVPGNVQWLVNNTNPVPTPITISSLDSAGHFSVTLTNTALIQPAQLDPEWQFSFCSQSILGQSPVCFTMTPLSLTSSQDISSIIVTQSLPLPTSGGGTSVALQTNSIPNASQVLLNLIAGTGISLFNTGGSVTVDAAVSGITTGGFLSFTGTTLGLSTSCTNGQAPIWNSLTSSWACGNVGGVGTLTGITTGNGSGLSGGGTSGSLNLSLITSCAVTQGLLWNGSAWACGNAGGGLADPGANGIIKRTALNVTAPAGYADVVALWASCTSGFLEFNGTCSSGTGAIQVNGAPLISTATVNFENSAATNGLTLTFTNPTVGNVQLGFTGTLANAGLANSAITIGGTSVALGGTTVSFPSPGPIGGTTPASGSFTTINASGNITGNLIGNASTATTATNAGGLSNCTTSTPGSLCYWNGTQWQVLPGNTSSSLFLNETSAGVPSWATPSGAGNVSTGGTNTSGYLATWTSNTTLTSVLSLPAANFPTLTGDVSNTGLATTVVAVNGGSVPASAKLLGSNSSSQPIAAALPSADLYVGNGSNLPAAVAASGDVSLANTGAFTVTGAQGKALPALSSFTSNPYLTYTGSAWAAANPFANPTFTGTITIAGFGGVIQCMQATASNQVVGTGSPCGSGGGGGNVTGPGSSVVGDVAYFNNTGGSLLADAGYPYNAIPNADLAHSTVGVAGTSNQITSSGSPVSLGGSTTLAFANPMTLTPAILTAGTTSVASLSMPSGVAPTSPASGNIWNLSGILQFYDGTNTNSLTTIQAAPTTLHLPEFSGTAGLLADSGIAVANVVTAAANFTSGDLVKAAASTRAASDSGIAAGDVLTYHTPATGIARTTSGSQAVVSTELSGDATTSGSNAVTVVKVNGLAVPASKTIVGTNSSSQFVDASSATLANNTTGTAANLSGTPALPNGTTATTQVTGDSSTKIATDAFVINEVAAGGPGSGTVNDLAFWNTGTTLGSIGSQVTGQILVAVNGSYPTFSSSSIIDSANSPVTSASYTLACDTSTTVVDRSAIVRFQSGATTPVVPLSTATGCSGMVVKVIDESAGILVFSRTSPDTFSVYNGSTATTGATSFTLTNGEYATVDQAASGIWEVSIVPSVGGTGTVTSVGMTVPTGLAIGGQPITTSGTLALTWSGTIPVAQIPTAIPIGNVGSAGLSGTSPVTISAAGAIGCANCAVINGVNTFTAAGTIDLAASTAAAALKIPSVASFTSNGTSSIGSDATAKITHVPTNGADSKVLATTATDTTTTHAVFATGTAGLYTSRAIAAGDLPSVPLTALASQAADTMVANMTASGAVPTAVAIPTTAHGVWLGEGTATAPGITAAGTAGQYLRSGGSGADGAYATFPDTKVFPAANCVSSVGGSAWDTTLTAACAGESVNVGGWLPFADASVAQFKFHLPADWDTTEPYINLAFDTATNTSGTMIFQVQTACIKNDGSTSDNPALNTAQVFSTATAANANRIFSENLQFNAVTSGNSCVANGTMIVKITRNTDTAAAVVGVTEADITIGRLLTLQAN